MAFGHTEHVHSLDTFERLSVYIINKFARRLTTRQIEMARIFDFLRAYSSEIGIIGNICIAFFTVILAFATLFLWWSTRELVRETEAHGERQLRAYVSLEKGAVQVVNLAEGGIGLMVQVELKNSVRLQHTGSQRG
ncbi:MAG: hypothetical protein ACXW3Q_05690 [Rhodoplanes sp.]